MRSSFRSLVSNVIKPESPRKTSPRAATTPTTSPRISFPIHLNPRRVIEVPANSWLGRHVFNHHIQMAYQNFLRLKELVSIENKDENTIINDKFYDAAQIFEIIERLGTVTYDNFLQHNDNGDVKYNVGLGRAATAPCYNPNADSVLVSQIAISLNGLFSYCATLASYQHKDNCPTAVRLTIELTRFADMIKSAHDIATCHVLALESEKKVERKSLVCNEMFSIFGTSAESPSIAPTSPRSLGKK